MEAVTQLGFADIIDSSKAMRHITQMLQQIANTPLNTLSLLGETGTGKDLFAKVLQQERGIGN